MATETTPRGQVAGDRAPEAGPATPGLVRRWREQGFGPASEEPYRRRTSDWIRLALATGLLVVLARHVGTVTDTERAVFNFFNTLPGGLLSLFRLLYGLGALWALGLVVVAALVGRRWRLARDLAIAGLASWIAARAIGAFVVDNDSIGKTLHAVVRFGHATPSFPLVRLAVVAAVVFVASPYVTRPTRGIGATLTVLVAFAALYLGTGYPDDVLAALVLGWGIAALVHLVFRSPGGRPTTRQVASALEELGVDAANVHLAPTQPTDSTLMLARDATGPLAVTVLGRDEADAQAMTKLWRFLAYKDAGPQLILNRRLDVEHEAYATLVAARAGVRVPEIVAAGEAGPGAALLVARLPDGPHLSELDADTVDDRLLRALWAQVGDLHAARVVHGRLNASAVVVTDTGPTIVDFRVARTTTAEAHGIAADIAELLASTAAIVGEERAVDAAARGVGTEALAAALPVMQPGALTRATRATTKRKDLTRRMERLRELSAQAAHTDVPTLQELHRISGTNLAMAVGTLVALVVLMGQVGSPQEMWDTVKSANWWLAVLAFGLSLSTNFAYAVALMGTVPIRLPLIPTAEVELAMSFSNLAIPGIGGIAVQIRYLQKQGVPIASAVAAGGFLPGLVGTTEQVALFLIALALSPASIHLGDIPTSSIVDLILIVILVAGVAAGLLFGVPRIRHRVMPPLAEALRTLWTALRSPRQLVLLFTGSVMATLLYGFVMFTCLHAFGGDISFWTVLACNIGVSTIAAMIPVPGGNTAVSAIGMSGALTAVGVQSEVAVATVLLYQIVVNYVPAVLGWFATHDLLEQDYI